MINYKGIKRAIGLGGLVLALNGTTINALNDNSIEKELDRARKQLIINLTEQGSSNKATIYDHDFDGVVDEVYDEDNKLVSNEYGLYEDVQIGYEKLITDLYQKMQQRKKR